MARNRHLDHQLRKWPYDPHSLSVRLIQGADGRDLIQLRVDMGILQLEVAGRPDGGRPEGEATYYDYLLSAAFHKGDDFELDEAQGLEVDREFNQYYHRRICWLKLQQYRRAVADADHTLALMDFCARHSSDEQWVMSHEQYRPFVLFHRTQAAALAELEEQGPETAVHELNCGLGRLRELFVEHEAEDHFEDDELVRRLVDMRESLRDEYEVGRTLHEQLADAVASEQYELAAQIRDKLARRRD